VRRGGPTVRRKPKVPLRGVARQDVRPGAGVGDLQRGATTPIIVCSGYNSQELGQRFTRYAFATFLQKPYTLGELRVAAQDVLQAHNR
jgi:hypothetical protein